MTILTALGAGAFGGIVSFWLMFVFTEWLFAPDEKPKPPRRLGSDGYRRDMPRWDPLA